ncbi:HAD family acid phosphatase [soil metagenome]
MNLPFLKLAARITLIALLPVCSVVGQSTPPSCSVGSTAKSIRPPAPRPTIEALQAVAAAAAADPTFLVAAEPIPNFGVERYRLADYTQCTGSVGCYWADLEAQTRRADVQLDALVALHKASPQKAEKMAIVLDIDETSLSSYCEEKREDYGFIPAMFNTWIVSPEASIPIPGTLRLFNHARSLGIEVFFLTGRAHEMTEATAHNLTTAGYKDWKGLILRADSEKTTATTEYKAAARARITAQGYHLILNMGDQWSDLNGSPKADLNVKLPNPYYYLP